LFMQAVEQLIDSKLGPMIWKMSQIEQKLTHIEHQLESL
jgi:hypothetical protein